jgi:hypothetical protein
MATITTLLFHRPKPISVAALRVAVVPFLLANCALCQEQTHMYPYQAPHYLEILHIQRITGTTIVAYGRSPDRPWTLEITSKTVFCTSDGSGGSVRVGDSSYLLPKIDNNEFVTFKLSKGNVVRTVWDFVPRGEPHVITIWPANGSAPTRQEEMHYDFPRTCK